jgi:hypothetical protein
MDRTVLRRSEPSSRTTFMGEQPNPWDLLQPQDVMSRHRGAKPSRRCELLEKISLFNVLHNNFVEINHKNYFDFHQKFVFCMKILLF